MQLFMWIYVSHYLNSRHAEDVCRGCLVSRWLCSCCVLCAHLSVLQAEIVKRLNAICAQVIPFLSQEVRTKCLSLWVKKEVGERERDWEKERRGGGEGKPIEGGEVCSGLWGKADRHGHTHACTQACTPYTQTDYPRLILPAQDRQICSELIKCLPLTYAGACSWVCVTILVFVFILHVCVCLPACTYCVGMHDCANTVMSVRSVFYMVCLLWNV